MREKTVAVTAALVLVLLGAVGYAYIEGVGPLNEDPDAGLEESPETEATYGMGSGTEGSLSGSDGARGGTDGGTETETDGPTEAGDTGPAFAFTVESVDRCGRTCREVNAALHNRRDEVAKGTVVYTRIYAGNSTDEEDLVWADNREIPSVEGGGVYRSTDRVKLSPQKAEEVRENDGLVTVEATVEGQHGTERFVAREDAT